MLRRTTAALRTVRVQDFGAAKKVQLDRQKALNALDLPMLEMMLPHYAAWRDAPPGSMHVVMRGAGAKAFCAGGDVVSLVKDEPKGVRKAFFYREYQLDHAVATLPHPHVALWDGIVMGGGFGVSVHGSHRVCTEATLFAMPETGIGLIPDVGGSWVLPRLPLAGMGMYLALTGQRLKGADALHAGLGTHFVAKEKIPALERALEDAETPGLEAALSAHAVPAADLPAFSLAPHLPLIAKCFGPDVASVEGVIAALEADGGDFALKTKATLLKMSPVMLKVSFAAQRRGATAPSIKEVFTMEYRIVQKATEPDTDFHRGVTALLIDKTGAPPPWQPEALAAVPPELVEAHFARGELEWHPTAPYPGGDPLFAAQ